jgi:hypothetical protein
VDFPAPGMPVKQITNWLKANDNCIDTLFFVIYFLIIDPIIGELIYLESEINNLCEPLLL